MFCSTFPNNDVIYRIDAGGKDKFGMDATTGLITVTNGADLDRDVHGTEYTLKVGGARVGGAWESRGLGWGAGVSRHGDEFTVEVDECGRGKGGRGWGRWAGWSDVVGGRGARGVCGCGH